MYSYRNDPDADGVGIAFCDAVAPDGGRLDLGAGDPSGWPARDGELVERDLGVRIVAVRQVHGNRVLVVDAASDRAAAARTAADALATTTRGLALAIRVADCLPVLFADVAAGVVGAAHAGRVGLADGVLVAAFERMAELGARQVTAWIGPHICGECYEVPLALRDSYTRAHPAALATTSWGTPSLDLGRAAAAQLAGLGCRVVRVDPCTRTTPSLHSYRRDPAGAGRQAGLVWLP